MKEHATRRDHGRVQLDRGGAHAQGAVAKARDRAGAQAELHRMAARATSSLSRHNIQAIMRCTYSSTITRGWRTSIAPWTQGVSPRACRSRRERQGLMYA